MSVINAISAVVHDQERSETIALLRHVHASVSIKIVQAHEVTQGNIHALEQQEHT